MNAGLHPVDVLEDLCTFIRWSIEDFSDDNFADYALPANAVEKTKQPMYNLRPISRLSRSKAAPNTCFQIKRRHGDSVVLA